jgi:hypothetical protein
MSTIWKPLFARPHDVQAIRLTPISGALPRKAGWGSKRCQATTRSRAEAAFGRYKKVIGDGLRSRKDWTAATEIGVAARVLNQMLDARTPSASQEFSRDGGFRDPLVDPCNIVPFGGAASRCRIQEVVRRD